MLSEDRSVKIASLLVCKQKEKNQGPEAHPVCSSVHASAIVAVWNCLRGRNWQMISAILIDFKRSTRASLKASF